VLREELRNSRRTIALATTTAVVVIAGLYAFAAWAMSVATGADHIVDVSTDRGAETVFFLAGQRLGDWAITVGHTLFVTSIVAAMISLHNVVARYIFVLGREHVLPAVVGRTWQRTEAPAAASMAQSGIGLAVIVIWAIAGWDPVLHLFYWLGTSGGLGVLILLLATSVAVPLFFARDHQGETRWRRTIAPTLAALALAGITVLAFHNLAALLGVAPGHPLVWIVPTVFAAVAVAGLAYGRWLRTGRPEVYARLGYGGPITMIEVIETAVVRGAVEPEAIR
jgi:amino acid transporter